jgi:hypothetical protein
MVSTEDIGPAPGAAGERVKVQIFQEPRGDGALKSKSNNPICQGDPDSCKLHFKQAFRRESRDGHTPLWKPESHDDSREAVFRPYPTQNA